MGCQKTLRLSQTQFLMKTLKSKLSWVIVGFIISLCLAWTVDHANFNTNQFSAVYPNVSLKTGLQTTNLTDAATVTAVTFAGSGASLTGIPLLSTVNLWANNNEWQAAGQFDSTLNAAGVFTAASSVDLGSSAAVGISNRAQIVNSLGQYVAQFGTNGTILFGTNNQVEIDPSGTITAGGLNTPTLNAASMNIGSLSVTNPPTFNLQSSTNLPSTNVVVSAQVLVSSGNQTNYTLNLLPGPSGNLVTIYPGNTNIFFTFTSTNQGNWHRSVLINAFSNSVPVSIGFASPVHKNLNYVGVVTNGTSEIFNFYNTDAAGTNVFASDAAPYLP